MVGTIRVVVVVGGGEAKNSAVSDLATTAGTTTRLLGEAVLVGETPRRHGGYRSLDMARFPHQKCKRGINDKARFSGAEQGTRTPHLSFLVGVVSKEEMLEKED